MVAPTCLPISLEGCHSQYLSNFVETRSATQELPSVLWNPKVRCRVHKSPPLVPLLSRDSSVGIATGYGLDDRRIGVRVQLESRIFTSPCRSDRLWGPHNLLSNGYRGLSGRDMKPTIHFQLVPRSRKRGSIHQLHYMPSWRSA
jgi:hypothetical protein